MITKQVLRRGTAIGALTEEAQQAESKADFIHKLATANKEVRETHYWLRLMRDSHKFTDCYSTELKQYEELMKLLAAIIKSSKK